MNYGQLAWASLYYRGTKGSQLDYILKVSSWVDCIRFFYLIVWNPSTKTAPPFVVWEVSKVISLTQGSLHQHFFSREWVIIRVIGHSAHFKFGNCWMHFFQSFPYYLWSLHANTFKVSGERERERWHASLLQLVNQLLVRILTQYYIRWFYGSLIFLIIACKYFWSKRERERCIFIPVSKSMVYFNLYYIRWSYGWLTRSTPVREICLVS